jgi:3-hydroxyisobutyrate dehydrogenase-like beta-hydroxyacid dehydrogenase
MGLPMASHLPPAGYSLSAYDIDPRAHEKLRARAPSAVILDSPRAVAAASDIVITMLPNGREVQSVVFGPGGLAEGLISGSLVLDTSSSEPWHTRETSERLARMGVAMVDAPVSGAQIGAEKAELVFMVGGDVAAMERVRPILQVLGKSIFHLGAVGCGHAMKSINNLITAVTFLATTEGLAIGRSYGLDPAVMVDVLNVSTGMSWISRTHIGQRILSRRFDDPFKLDLMVKDIEIALKIANDQHLEIPLSLANREIWLRTQREIPGGSSVSELVRALEKHWGVEISSVVGGKDDGKSSG